MEMAESPALEAYLGGIGRSGTDRLGTQPPPRVWGAEGNRVGEGHQGAPRGFVLKTLLWDTCLAVGWEPAQGQGHPPVPKTVIAIVVEAGVWGALLGSWEAGGAGTRQCRARAGRLLLEGGTSVEDEDEEGAGVGVHGD